TYGASQRGGSVMSHVRVSRRRQFGPLMPPGSADLVISLEPTEAARVLGTFGNPQTVSVVNTRPVQPVDVICGDLTYPPIDLLFAKIRSLSSKSFFLPATDKALELGNPILANVVLLGAVAGANLLPISVQGLEKAVTDYMSAEKVPINRSAFLCGVEMVKNSQSAG
ncbi:MAG: 2-oxoacid:acceptor oxidoreductase family protein, partial [Deltaproteobacteria bacterium]|nr:2-oxoacid:acceptor oxidoreductase family protein [Deltaproteobacteria bacterium]